MARPSLIIIGAQKAATTSLYMYLTQHPQMLPASKKEIHYFDLNFSRGMAWYASHFPYKSKLEKIGGLTLEASPTYLFYPSCARRMAELLPDVRLLVSLRNPVDRAYSHWKMAVRKGREMRSFEEIIEEYYKRKAVRGQIECNEPTYQNLLHRNSYILSSMYYIQLCKYLIYFPISSIHFVCYEEFAKEPQPVLDSICEFLGIGAHRFDTSNKHFESDGEQVSGALRKKVEQLFVEQNQQLYGILDRDLGWS